MGIFFKCLTYEYSVQHGLKAFVWQIAQSDFALFDGSLKIVNVAR